MVICVGSLIPTLCKFIKNYSSTAVKKKEASKIQWLKQGINSLSHSHHHCEMSWYQGPRLIAVLGTGSANYSLLAKSNLPTFFVNKKLLRHSHANLLCLIWLLYRCNDRVAWLWQKLYRPQSRK